MRNSYVSEDTHLQQRNGTGIWFTTRVEQTSELHGIGARL
jgi:hypothetical protein